MTPGRRLLRHSLACLLLLIPAWGGFVPAQAQDRRVYAVGGGYKSQEGLKQALSHATPSTPEGPLVVYIGYASTVPEGALKTYSDQLAKEGVPPSRILPLLGLPGTPEEEAAHAAILSRADLIVMSGGDQSRLLPALQKPAIARALRARYEAGAPVVVTSASSAQLGPKMFTGAWASTGDGIRFEVIDGLDWFDFIFDTHFLTYRLKGEDATSGKIGREGRITDVLGRGILQRALSLDEDAMVEIVNELQATVIGPQQVIAYRRAGKRILRVSLWPGDQLNLYTWLPTFKDPKTACGWVFAGEDFVRAPKEY